MRSPESPRARRRAAKIETIKEEALALVLEDGVASFSVHRLAERLDLTVGALYRYFDSVDHLLASLQVDVLCVFDAYFDAVIESTEKKGIFLAVELVWAYMALSEIAPERFRLISRFVSSMDPLLNDDAAAQAVEPTMRLFAKVATSLEEAIHDAELSPGDSMDRALLLWSSVHGLLERQKLGRLQVGLFDVDRLGSNLIQTLLVGWGAKRDVVESAIDQRLKQGNLRAILNTI